MNIEEFVNDYLQEHRHDVLLNPHNGLVEFSEALKAEALKEAVEGKIGELGFHNAVYLQEPKWTIFLDGFKKGDKVRIIIVKED